MAYPCRRRRLLASADRRGALMCTCASCTATDALADNGFAAWPRGNPAGPRRSAADYAAHVAHGKTGLATGWTFKCGAAPKFSNDPPVSDFVGSRTGTPGCNPVTQAPRLVLDFIAAGYKKTGQAEAQPVSPASACKPPQHFPELDRQRGASRIYAMQKDQPKRIRGRPAIDGRRVVIKLAERDIARARELGGGGKQAIAAGVRMALRQSSG